jgi:hypothetical protein
MTTNQRVIPRVRQALAFGVGDLCKVLGISQPLSVLNATRGEIERLHNKFLSLVKDPKCENAEPFSENHWKVRIAKRQVEGAMQAYRQARIASR